MNPQIVIACIQINLLKTPLLRVATTQDVLNKSRDEVNAMIESGELPFAFDLSAKPSSRKEPRIFSLCVAEKSGWKNPIGQTKNFKLPEVIGMILPKRDVRSSELKRLFACSRDLICSLAKDLRVARQPAVSDGPNCYTVFHRESVEKFLTGRRMS
jgi:hypothetical protein